ncbi:MAG: hypothetical protein IKA99_05740, partial [Clostridia bacterium]|nr:hypothetical protein [Clostridia bacterium]
MGKTIKNRGSVYFNAVQLIVVGSVTGIFVGIIVTLYNLCASFAETKAKHVYSFIRQNPAFIPLLIIVLLMGALFLSVAI